MSRPLTLAVIFSKALLATRQAKKMTQEEVARASGLSVSYVSMLERGTRTAPLSTVETIAAALKVRPLALLGG